MCSTPPATETACTQITASAERHIDAPAGRVYFRRHHPSFLPSQFSDFAVETGGVGAGTVHRFRMTLGGRTTAYQVRVDEPEPGRVLTESDPARRMLTTFTVEPEPVGGSRVRIETRWFSGGIRGIVKRAVAPRMLRRVYRDQLELLDRYANGAATFAAQRKQLRGKRLQSLIRAKDLRRGAHPQ